MNRESDFVRFLCFVFIMKCERERGREWLWNDEAKLYSGAVIYVMRHKVAFIWIDIV